MSAILTVNAGSTSVKAHLVSASGRARAVDSLAGVDPESVGAVAHRVVHLGTEAGSAVVIDADVRESIVRAAGLAPLHNAAAIAGIDEARGRFPGVPHVAVSDRAFHRTLPAEAATYALPRAWREDLGIRRGGYHGLSVAWSAERAPALLGRSAAGLRLVVCHLGGGSSVTAVRAGRSMDTTMGFSPLDGLPMATRSGSVDPGALIHLLRAGVTIEELERTLQEESGLRALAGRGGDMRRIEEAAAAGEPDAILAMGVLCHRVAGAIASMAAAIGGLDALAFTGGVGEGSAAVRADVCARLAFLGVRLAEQPNVAGTGDRRVSPESAPVGVLVVRAREELMLARAARALTRPGRRDRV